MLHAWKSSKLEGNGEPITAEQAHIHSPLVQSPLHQWWQVPHTLLELLSPPHNLDLPASLHTLDFPASPHTLDLLVAVGEKMTQVWFSRVWCSGSF